MPEARYDVRGYKLPEGHSLRMVGKPPANKGRQYPPDPPTVEEIGRLIRSCPDDPYGLRRKTLIIFLWRAGLRIGEALALKESDLGRDSHAVIVRNGKGGKRRISGMDEWAWAQIEPWLDFRKTLPVGELICNIQGVTAGRAWRHTAARREIHKATSALGIRRRIAPHQLRHAHACELVRDGVRLDILQRQLGHSNLAITTTYLEGISPVEVTETIAARSAPVVPLC